MNKEPVAGRIFNPDPTLRLGAPSQFFALRARLVELAHRTRDLEREVRRLRRALRAAKRRGKARAK